MSSVRERSRVTVIAVMGRVLAMSKTEVALALCQPKVGPRLLRYGWMLPPVARKDGASSRQRSMCRFLMHYDSKPRHATAVSVKSMASLAMESTSLHDYSNTYPFINNSHIASVRS